MLQTLSLGRDSRDDLQQMPTASVRQSLSAQWDISLVRAEGFKKGCAKRVPSRVSRGASIAFVQMAVAVRVKVSIARRFFHGSS